MIRKCSEEDRQIIMDYIGTEYSRCLYLYLDLQKYGFDSDTAEVFVQQSDGIVRAVLLCYYSCLHVYSRDDSFCADELCKFIENSDLTMIYCVDTTAARIYESLSCDMKDRASVSTGWVAQIRNTDKKSRGLAEPAMEKDFYQIAKLVFDDEDIGRSYRFDELAKQLEERNREGFARNYVIRKDGLVIAHACTNAEFEGIAVVAELLVRKEYRRQGLASEIWRSICEDLLSEGKEVYSFYYLDESRRLHHKIGFTEVCCWSKIVISR